MFNIKWLDSFYRLFTACLWISTSVLVTSIPLRNVQAIEQPGAVLANDVGIFTVLGTKVNLEHQFTDHTGRAAPLKDLITPGLPAIFVPVYYRCPRLCGLVLDGLITLLNEIPLLPGKDFSVLAISINPSEGYEEANKAREKFLPRLKVKEGGDSNALRFLVGTKDNIDALMGELGFKFLPDGDDFAHSAAVMILTPLGEISQYFTGNVFSPWDARLGLVEASNGRIGNAIDHFLLYCFRFDSLQGKYTWAVTSVLRIGGVLTLLLLGAVLWFVARRKRHEGRAS